MAGLTISGTQVPAWMALSVGVAAVLYRDVQAGRGAVARRGRTRVAPFITAAILFYLTTPGAAVEGATTGGTVWCAPAELVASIPTLHWSAIDLAAVPQLQSTVSPWLSLVSQDLGVSEAEGTVFGHNSQAFVSEENSVETFLFDTPSPGASTIEKPQHGKVPPGKTRPYSCSSPRT